MKIGNIDSPNIIDTTCELVHDKFIDDYTKLLLHCDGADAATSMVDSAKNATVTFAGTAQIDTAQSKFGGASLLLDGNSDYVSLADSENWNFGNNNFTVDFWVRFSSTSGQQMFFCQYADANNFLLMYKGSGHQLTINGKYGGMSTIDFSTDAISWSTDTWYHIAFVRDSTTGRIFVNGVLQPPLTITTSFGGNNTGNIAATLYIGWDTASAYVNGWLEEYRVSKGIARWTANFTPPTQSYDCPLDTQTKLLIHGGGPNNGTTFYDNSTTARTLTTVNHTKFDTSQYKFRVSSVYFDGTDDYITAPDSADWYFGTGNFSIDFWIRFSDISGTHVFVSQWVDGNNGWFVQKRDAANGHRLRMYFITGGVVKGEYVMNSDWSVSTGVWYHLAYVRSGGQGLIYINGVSQSLTESTSFSTNDVGDIASTLFIGQYTNGSWVKGWMDEIRVSKGIARYYDNFTPPTAPYDSPLTQYVIDGLDGDTDKEYRYITNCVNGYSGGTTFRLRINNDTGSNYGYQYIAGQSSTASAARAADSFIQLTAASALGYVGMSDSILYAKTGKVRTTLDKGVQSINGTTVDLVASWGHSWNNTVDNITNLNFNTDTLNGFGAGTRLILLKKRQLTTGTKTGEIDPAGFSSARTYGHWQLIYDNTLTSARNLALSSEMDSYTKLLIHADGADASTAFLDFSNSAHVITANGNAQVDTAQSKFGGASALFDGTGDYLTIPDSDDWAFGSGDFTIDFWAKWNTLPTSGNTQAIICQWDDVVGRSWLLQIYNNSGTYQMVFQRWNPANYYVYTVSSVTTGVWYHFACVCSSGTVRWYQNGAEIGTGQSIAGALDNVTSLLSIGAYLSSGSGAGMYMNGWIDELRVSKGIARWTANFTPPTQAYNELDGDRDILYRCIIRSISNGASNYYFNPNFEGDSLFGRQLLYGQNTTIAASRSSGSYSILYGYGSASGKYSYADILFYAKSGFVRPVLLSHYYEMSGTTVELTLLTGAVFNDTTNKISYFFVYGGGAALQTGSHVELWRLNL